MNPPPIHPPPFYDRMKAAERGEGLSIQDLCRPLSATVLPKRAMIGINGNELTEDQARKQQRSTGRPPKPAAQRSLQQSERNPK